MSGPTGLEVEAVKAGGAVLASALSPKSAAPAYSSAHGSSYFEGVGGLNIQRVPWWLSLALIGIILLLIVLLWRRLR